MATVDLPTPPLPLATASTVSTPGIGCGPRRACGWGAGSRTTVTGTATPGMAVTAARTASSICWTTSSWAVLGARWTAVPDDET